MIFIFVFCVVIATGCAKNEWLKNSIYETQNESIYDQTMKRDLLCLMMAYPEYAINVEKGTDNKVYLVMKSGKRIVYDDKRIKNFKEKLINPDLQDMMEQVYPIHDIKGLMDEDFDPGRIRVYPLLKEVYGHSKEAILSNIVNVKIGYKNCPFNGNSKAAHSLDKVMKELISLAQNQNNIYDNVFPINGTFNYRLIAGTNRLSPHSFGTAIDLKRDKRDYWKWASREEGQKRLDSYPREIVKAFERNHFIWGGKWGHFDILHFEYRPELIMKAKYFSKNPHVQKKWYDGVLFEENKDGINEYIHRIDKALK